MNELKIKQQEIDRLNNRIKFLENALNNTDYNKKYNFEVKAKQLVRKLLGLYFSPIVTNKDLEMQDEIIKEAKEFLNM